MRRGGLVTAGRYAWASTISVLGGLLVAAALASGGRASFVAGVLEAHGGVIAILLRYVVPLRGGASAMTLGHVVVGRDRDCLQRTRAHERIHVRQCERWGPLFVQAYVLASLCAALQGRHYYRGNRFEREANAATSGRMPRDSGFLL